MNIIDLIVSRWKLNEFRYCSCNNNVLFTFLMESTFNTDWKLDDRYKRYTKRGAAIIMVLYGIIEFDIKIIKNLWTFWYDVSLSTHVSIHVQCEDVGL